MQSCLEVDHKTRPTFHQLVPELEALLNDGHKKYYDSINEMFKNKAKKSFDSDNVDNELNEPLLTKDEKRIKAAVKMVKGN